MQTRYSTRHTAARRRGIPPAFAALVFVAAALLLCARPAGAQGFSSGSTGADGALNFSNVPAGTTVEFNPAAFNPPLDPERDNIYNFTTINIPAGVTVKLSAKYLNGPVVWLATGAVQINGILDLKGGAGHEITSVPANRIPSVPGPGGFGGGLGGHSNGTRPAPAQSGHGPAGGIGTGPNSHGNGGSFSGSRFLVPLVGGSGGAGGNTGGPDNWGGGGGAGGGAILIVSTTNIIVNGSILADAGDGGGHPNNCCSRGGGGGGGAIRLVAGTISGSGRLSAHWGDSARGGGFGFVRLEAFRHEFNGTFNNGRGETPVARSSPSTLFLPSSPAPSVRAVSVAGVPVPTLPNGSFEAPDVVINQGGAATIAIEARFVPPGTVVKVHIFTENAGDQLVDSTPLQGTLEQSTATASVVFPSGFSRGFVRAVWR